MNTQIVYVLVSRQDDNYSEQLLLSMYSLFKFNKDVFVTIVCDEESAILLKENHSFGLFNNVKLLPLKFESDISLKERSRILKTSLRKLVRGDYLFIDTDTIICSDLTSIDTLEADVAMAYDVNRNDKLSIKDIDIIERCSLINKKMNIINYPYFNSGIIYSKDTKISHTLYEKWHKNWTIGKEQSLFSDQPSLCISNIEMGEKIQRLDDSWNWQFKYGSQIKQPKIMHYFNPAQIGDIEDRPLAYLLYNEIKKRGLNIAYIDKLLDNPTTVLKTILEINKTEFGLMCASPLTEMYFNRRKIYTLCESLGKRIRLIDNKIKRIFKK